MAVQQRGSSLDVDQLTWVFDSAGVVVTIVVVHGEDASLLAHFVHVWGSDVLGFRVTAGQVVVCGLAWHLQP